jgi:hypothetical protein
MGYSAVPTAVTGSVVTAAYGNILRDNDAAFKAILDGTAQALGTSFSPTTDTGYHLDLVSGDPRIIFDTNDYEWYLRSTNVWTIVIGGNSVITLDANGKITGKGFYDSGEVAVTNGSAITVSHGLSARPRFYSIFKATATGSADSKTIVGTNPALTTVSSTQLITTNNSDGATRYCNLYAEL